MDFIFGQQKHSLMKILKLKKVVEKMNMMVSTEGITF